MTVPLHKTDKKKINWNKLTSLKLSQKLLLKQDDFGSYFQQLTPHKNDVFQ